MLRSVGRADRNPDSLIFASSSLPVWISLLGGAKDHTILFLGGRSFYLTVRSFLLTIGLVAYSKLAWPFLLVVEMRFGLFFAYSGNRFDLTYSSHDRKVGLVFFAYGYPTVSKKDEP